MKLSNNEPKDTCGIFSYDDLLDCYIIKLYNYEDNICQEKSLSYTEGLALFVGVVDFLKSWKELYPGRIVFQFGRGIDAQYWGSNIAKVSNLNYGADNIVTDLFKSANIVPTSHSSGLLESTKDMLYTKDIIDGRYN